MRTTIELSDETYRRLRAAAAERGTRGFSPIVEEAVVQLLDRGPHGEGLASQLAAAEGAWTAEDVEEWERARREAWETWRTDRSSTRTS